MAIKEWTTNLPTGPDVPAVDQPDLINDSFPGAGDGDQTRVSQIHAVRDIANYCATTLGSDLEEGGSIRERVTTLEGAVVGDEKVKVSVADVAAGYLLTKVIGASGLQTAIAFGGGVEELRVAPTYGVIASTVCQGNDVRLADDRTPLAHTLAGAKHSADTLANLNTKISDANLGYPIVPVAAGPVVIDRLDSGLVYTNEGAGGDVVFLLPTPLAGTNFTFCCQCAKELYVYANAADTIRVDNTATTAGGFIESNEPGCVVKLVAINGTEWVAFCLMGLWGVFIAEDETDLPLVVSESVHADLIYGRSVADAAIIVSDDVHITFMVFPSDSIDLEVANEYTVAEMEFSRSRADTAIAMAADSTVRVANGTRSVADTAVGVSVDTVVLGGNISLSVNDTAIAMAADTVATVP